MYILYLAPQNFKQLFKFCLQLCVYFIYASSPNFKKMSIFSKYLMHIIFTYIPSINIFIIIPSKIFWAHPYFCPLTTMEFYTPWTCFSRKTRKNFTPYGQTIFHLKQMMKVDKKKKRRQIMHDQSAMSISINNVRAACTEPFALKGEAHFLSIRELSVECIMRFWKKYIEIKLYKNS